MKWELEIHLTCQVLVLRVLGLKLRSSTHFISPFLSKQHLIQCIDDSGLL